MDDVFRIDLANTETTDETVTYEQEIICSLGIMSKDSTGKFRGTQKLTKSEYEAARVVIYTGENVDFNVYNEKYANMKVYQKEIAAGMLGFVENTTIDVNSDFMETEAAANILKGVNYNAEKEMTRADFATVIWNTLNSNYVSYDYSGDTASIKTEDEKTILNDKFDTYEIKGFMNAVCGLNIYGTTSPREGYVEIDRVKYKTNGVKNTEAFLGHIVDVHVRYDEKYDEYELLNIKTDKKDDAVTVDLKDTDRVRDGYIYYESEAKGKKVNISDVKYILYNGNVLQAITEDMLDGNGSVTVSKSEMNGKYDTAVIKNYQNFLMKKYVANDKKLYLNYTAQFNGKYYIDMDIDNGTVICEIDGVRSSIDKLKVNSAISIIQNDSRTYTEIIANTAVVKGTVKGKIDESWIIEGEEYTEDSYFKELAKDSSTGAIDISIGSVGKFYYTKDKVIVGFESDGAAQFALLKKAWQDDDNEDTYYIRIFTQSGEWANYQLADRVETDGTKYDKSVAINKIKSALDELKAPTPIRIKLIGDKIKFVDTLVDEPEESSDSDRMVLCGTFNGKTTWVKGWDMGSSNYHVGDATPMFIIPDEKNLDDESEYSIGLGTSIPYASTSVVRYSAYNPDKYLCARLAVYQGGVSQSGDEQFIYIKNVEPRYVNDEVVEGVSCYLFTRSKVELDDKFYELPYNWREKWGVTEEDINNSFVPVWFNGSEISGIDLTPGHYVKDFKVTPDSSGKTQFFNRESSRNVDWVAGTVIDVDVTRNYMLLDCGDAGIRSVYIVAYVAGRVKDGDPKHKVEGVTAEAINAGDRIFYWGSLRRAYYILDIYD